jgi:hypothetical protein
MNTIIETLVLAAETYGVILVSLIIVLALVDLVLRACGMWRAARMNEKGWFVAMFVISSAGILPTIYLILTKERYSASK